MKNPIVYALCSLLSASFLWSCKENLNAPVLPPAESDPVPAAVAINADDVAGMWSVSDSMHTYRLEMTTPEDAEAVLSHIFVSATSRMTDSVMNLAYTYTLDNGVFAFTPTAAAVRMGASPLKGVHLGNKEIALFVTNGDYTNCICTVRYTRGPMPVIIAVSKTMPQAGELVRVSGRNLQAVDQVFLPVEGGWKEVTNPTITSKQISFIVPEGGYVQGSVRCRVSADSLSVYSPAYMFATAGIMLHSFNEWGTTKADRYAGSEFEYTINDMGQLRSNVQYCSAANLPAGHSLAASSTLSPDSMLSFFGATPIDWPAVSGSDDKKGYLRFSTGDRLRAALARYGALSDSPVKTTTPCSDLALQMDLYVVTNGEPEWNTGYISYRMNKDRNSTGDGSVANTAGWEQESPMRFDDGWQTYTIPLSAFSMTSGQTIEALARTLIDGNLQTILTVMNYGLDEDHPARSVSGFQMSVANIRLVPAYTPNTTKE